MGHPHFSNILHMVLVGRMVGSKKYYYFTLLSFSSLFFLKKIISVKQTLEVIEHGISVTSLLQGCF